MFYFYERNILYYIMWSFFAWIFLTLITTLENGRRLLSHLCFFDFKCGPMNCITWGSLWRWMYYFSSLISMVREKEIIDTLELPTTRPEQAHHTVHWQLPSGCSVNQYRTNKWINKWITNEACVCTSNKKQEAVC